MQPTAAKHQRFHFNIMSKPYDALRFIKTQVHLQGRCLDSWGCWMAGKKKKKKIAHASKIFEKEKASIQKQQ